MFLAMENLYQDYLKKLEEFLSFKSVSTSVKYYGEMEKTVEWLKNILTNGGFESQIWTAEGANPVLFANYIANEDLPTILIYGHYDVQPASVKDGWASEPFSLKFDEKKLYGRGVVDNKGQILLHIVTVLEAIKEGDLKYNIKFLIEGNEESGSGELYGIIKDKKKEMECDIVLISDGELTNGKPTIEVSLRGGFNVTLKFKTGKTNLHSGIFGGAIPNASMEMSKFLSKLFNDDNSISYSSFYTDVDPISPDDLENNICLERESENIASLAGVKQLVGEKGVDFFTLTGNKPTIQITGINTGYIGQGYANIVPAEAEVRLNFRIVTSQNPKKVYEDFQKFVSQNVPDYVEYSLLAGGFHEPIKVDSNNKFYEEAKKVLERVYGRRINKKFVGGAIPVVADFKNAFGTDTLLVPLCNEDCNMHGINENFDIDLVKKGLEFSREMLTNRKV